MKDIDQDKINELGGDVLNLIVKHSEVLQPYEIGHQLISQSVSMLLCTAPNVFTAVKTIMGCIESGIAEYQESHYKPKRKKSAALSMKKNKAAKESD